MKDVLLLYFKRKEGTSFKWQSAQKRFFLTLKTMCNICVEDRTIYILNAKRSHSEQFYKMQKVIDIK